MNTEKDQLQPNESQITKENQDLPNIPASTEKVEKGETFKEEIKKTSKLHQDGKTDNTEREK